MPKDLTFLLLPQVTKANIYSERSPLISTCQMIFFAQPFSLWLSVPVKIWSSLPWTKNSWLRWQLRSGLWWMKQRCCRPGLGGGLGWPEMIMDLWGEQCAWLCRACSCADYWQDPDWGCSKGSSRYGCFHSRWVRDHHLLCSEELYYILLFIFPFCDSIKSQGDKLCGFCGLCYKSWVKINGLEEVVCKGHVNNLLDILFRSPPIVTCSSKQAASGNRLLHFSKGYVIKNDKKIHSYIFKSMI